MDATDVLLLTVGLVIVVATLADVVATLVATAGSGLRWRLTHQFYRWTWALWSRASRRVRSPERREAVLAFYAPLSLLALLTLWLVALLFAWSLVWVALADDLRRAGGYGSLLYYSGTVLVTLGFGDITPASLPARLLTLVEAATGLATIALVISYLPALYGAYGRRETRLLTLDHPSGERIQPTGLVELHAPDGDLTRLYRFFEEWELWVAEVLESHVSYPMLALFRSQHQGQSWITALGVVVDAAALVSATVEGADEREAFFAYRRGRRAITEIQQRLGPPEGSDPQLDRDLFGEAYGRLQKLGLPMRDPDEAWELLCELRNSYGPALESLIAYLVAPPGFWGHSAEDVLAEPRLGPGERDPES